MWWLRAAASLGLPVAGRSRLGRANPVGLVGACRGVKPKDA